jgi:aminomethyltransferase
MKQTPLTFLHRAAEARLVEFAGYEMPVEYSGVNDEHNTVRNAAGIFDVCHMGEFWIKGASATDLLQYITTNDVSAISEGQAQYNCMPNGRGGIVDDLIIYKYSTEKYLLVVNASNMAKDWDWISKHNQRFGAEMEDASERMALIALQGPRSSEILQPLVSFKLETIDSFWFKETTIDGVGEVIISATGYTGAGGFELFCYNEGAVSFWKKLMDLGKTKGLKPAGLASRDTLRLEKGYCLYGNDIDDTTSPIEAGLGWIVKMKAKGEFIDRGLIENQLAKGVSRRLVGIELLERGIPRHGYTILSPDQKEIGHITSGTMSPTLQKGIGMGYVSISHSKPGSPVLIQVRNKNLSARVVKLPFL